MKIYEATRGCFMAEADPKRYVDMPVEQVIDTSTYQERDQAILEMFDRGFAYWIWRIVGSDYVKQQRKVLNKSLYQALRWVFKYWKVFRSIKRHGYRIEDPSDAKARPWVFHARELVVRTDGHHRAAICRFLGVKFISVRSLWPSELLAWDGTPDDVKPLLVALTDPDGTGQGDTNE